MTDKPTPTDAEIDALWRFEASKNWGSTLAMRTSFARAVLAKWGTPAGAEEVENLRKALVYAAFALHGTPQYMLAQGIALIGGDTVRVSRDGWTVEASVNPHRQPAPATQQAGATGKCMGPRCMASSSNGYAHSRECIDEAAETQGWMPTADDYAKSGPSRRRPGV